MPKSWPIRISVIGALGVLVALVALANTTSSFAPSPDQPPPNSTPLPPAFTPPPEQPPMSFEEAKRWRERVMREEEGYDIKVSGPETKGRLINVAGINVQLPPDTYVNAFIGSVLCGAGDPCPETPIYVIKRGNSTIAVSIPSGTIVGEDIAEGEQGAFDFLKEVLP